MKPKFASLAALLLSAALTAADGPALLRQADAAEAAGLPHLAAHDIAQARRAGSDSPDLLRRQARLLQAQGYPTLARSRWRALLKLQPGDAEALQALAAVPDAKPTAVAAPSQAGATSLEPGQGVWVNGDINARVKAINAFNLKAPKLQRLKYVFVSGGQVRVNQGRAVLSLDLRPVRMAGAGLAGDAQAFLWLDVEARGARGLTPEAWDRCAGELAEALKDERRIAGIHLCPRPATRALYPLYSALRRRVALPLSVQVSTAGPETFAFADLLVLQAWDRGKSDLEAYRLRVSDQVRVFLRAAAAAQGKALVGVPARGPQGLERLDIVREAVSDILDPEQEGPLGLAYFGLVDDDSGLPGAFDTAVWDKAILPVAAP